VKTPRSHAWRRRLVLAAVVIGVATASCVACAAMQNPPEAPPRGPAAATVSLALDRPGRVIPRTLFGSNLQWEHNGDLILGKGEPAERWAPEGITEAVREAGVTSLRFPGGTLADTYRWRAGVGPRAAREKGRSFGGAPIPSTFGSDEYIRLCRELGVQPIVTVNVSVAPEEAADWAEYLNGAPTTTWGAKRATHGSPEPLRTVYWEFGNEVYSPGEPGHLEAKAYAEKFLAFAKEMRKRVPGVKLGVTLDVAFLQAAWMKWVMPHMTTWNEDVLKIAGPEVDFAVVHWYAPFDKVKGDSALAQLIWSSPDVLGENLGRIRALLRTHARPGAEIAITEYGTAFNDKGFLDQRITSTEHALHVALILMQLMGEPDVVIANNWSLLNNSVFGILETASSGTLRRRPSFEVFKELSAFGGRRIVPVQVTGDAYRVKAIGNIPERPEVSIVRASAALGDGGELRVALVNRSADRSAKVTLRVAGAKGTRALRGVVLEPASRGGDPAPAWAAPRPVALDARPDRSFELEVPSRSLVVLMSGVP
jgi:alpha-N-arabinofuranosidase